MPRFLAYLLRIMVLIIGIVVLTLIFLPSLLRTEWGKEQMIAIMNFFVSDKIEVSSIDLHWFQGQRLQGIRLTSVQKHIVVEIEELSTEGSLWNILTQNSQLGLTQVKNFQAIIFNHKDNSIPKDGKIANEEHLPSSLTLSQVNVKFNFTGKKQPLSAFIQGVTQEGNQQGSFEINLILPGVKGSSWKELMQNMQHYFEQALSLEANIWINVDHFPSRLIDQLFSFNKSHWKSPFQALFGDYFNLNIEKSSHLRGDFDVDVQSPRLQAKMKGQLTNELLTLEEPIAVNWSLSPQFFNAFSSPKTQLQSDVPIQLTLPYLSIPIPFLKSGGTTDFCPCGFDLNMTLPKTDIQLSRVGVINVQHLKAQLQSLAGSSEFLLKVVGRAEYYRKPTNINYEIKLNKPSDFEAFLHLFSKF